MTYRMKRLLEILVVLLLVFAVVYFAIRSWNSAQAKKAAEAAQSGEGSATAAGISAITYNNGSATLSFKKNDAGEWIWSEHEDYPLDTGYIEELASAISGISPTTTIESGEGEALDAYGLDSPAATVDATRSDGSVLSLQLGNATDQGTYYMKYADSDTVYVIAATIWNDISRSIYDMYSLESFPALSASNISTVTIEGETTSIYTVRKEGEGDQAKYLWYNGAANVNDDETVQSMAEELSSLAFSSCVLWDPLKDSTELCGLAEPAVTLRVAYTDENARESTLTLYFGGAADENAWYVRWDDSTTIYSISKDSVAAIMTLAAK